MHANRTGHISNDEWPSPPIQALGVADVLRVTLASCQTSWFLDEVRELRNALEAQDPAKPSARDVASDLRVLARLASELQPGVDAAAAVVGPAPLISELVQGTTRHVVEVLVDRLASHPAKAARDGAELVALATAVATWVDAYVALLAIEWFELDD